MQISEGGYGLESIIIRNDYRKKLLRGSSLEVWNLSSKKGSKNASPASLASHASHAKKGVAALFLLYFRFYETVLSVLTFIDDAGLIGFRVIKHEE